MRRSLSSHTHDLPMSFFPSGDDRGCRGTSPASQTFTPGASSSRYSDRGSHPGTYGSSYSGDRRGDFRSGGFSHYDDSSDGDYYSSHQLSRGIITSMIVAANRGSMRTQRTAAEAAVEALALVIGHRAAEATRFGLN